MKRLKPRLSKRPAFPLNVVSGPEALGQVTWGNKVLGNTESRNPWGNWPGCWRSSAVNTGSKMKARVSLGPQDMAAV